MSFKHSRLGREKRTVAAMVRIYCRRHHGAEQELCADCKALVRYAHQRLDRCAFQEDKPTCAHCPIHCYQPAMREKIRAVMRYSGPRMLLRHPILAICHLLDGLRRAPNR